MKTMKKLPIVRINDVVINLDSLNTAWYDPDSSSAGYHVISYVMLNSDVVYHISFGTKKAALAGLDDLMAAVDIPVINEDDD